MEDTMFSLNSKMVQGGKELNCEYMATQDKYNMDITKVSWIIDGKLQHNEYKTEDVDNYFDSGIWVRLIK